MLLTAPNVELDAVVPNMIGARVVGAVKIMGLAVPFLSSYVEVERVRSLVCSILVGLVAELIEKVLESKLLVPTGAKLDAFTAGVIEAKAVGLVAMTESTG